MAEAIANTVLKVRKVVVPVAIRAASESKDVTIGRAAPDGSRLCRIDVPDPGRDATTLIVDPLRRNKKGQIQQAQYDGDARRGVWQGDQFREIKAADLEAIDEATQIDEIVVNDFVPLKEVPWERVTGAYFLTPQEGIPQWLLAMLAKALKRKRAAGVTKIALRQGGRQKLAVIHAVNGGLMVNTLRFTPEFARVQTEMVLDGDGATAEMVGLVEQIIEQQMQPVTVLDEYADDVAAIKSELVAKALAGKPIEKRAKKAQAQATDAAESLMGALRASVAAEKTRRRKAATPARA